MTQGAPPAGGPWEFDTDTEVRPEGDGRWRGLVSDRWSIAGIPNGGYVMALVLRAVTASLPHPHPLTATSHFLGQVVPGEALVEVEVVKTGRRLSTAAATLVQDGRERLRCLATFGDLGAMDGPTAMASGPPPLGPDEELSPGLIDPAVVSIADRFDYRVPEWAARGAAGEPSGRQEVMGRIRFADGREPDVLCLPLVVDAFPPVVFQLGHYGWTPTLELTVHLRGLPAPGWLTASIRTRFLRSGLLEEDAEVWDSAGRLVAISRQLAMTGPG